MSRPRRFETDYLIGLVEEYLMNKCDYRDIKPVDLARYGNEKYRLEPELNYQDFTRNPRVKEFIDRYNNSLESKIMDKDGNLLVNQDISLDVRELYNVSFAKLEKKVNIVNEQLKKVSEINNALIAEINKMRADNKNIRNEKIGLEKRVLELEEEKDKLILEKNDVTDKLKSEKRIKIRLQEYIEKNITDPIVQQHLVDIGMLKKSDVTNEFRKDIDMEKAVFQFYSEDVSVLSKEETEILERLNNI